MKPRVLIRRPLPPLGFGPKLWVAVVGAVIVLAVLGADLWLVAVIAMRRWNCG